MMRDHKNGDTLPIRTVLTMTHPELPLVHVSEQPVLPNGQAIAFRNAASPLTEIFYPMTCAFYDYLVARTGNAAIVVELAGAFRADQPLDRLISGLVLGVEPDADLAELDADFDAFLISDPRYQAARR